MCLLGFLWHIVCFDPGFQFLKKYLELCLHTYIQILDFDRKGLINISGSTFGTNVLMKMLLSIFIFLPAVGSSSSQFVQYTSVLCSSICVSDGKNLKLTEVSVKNVQTFCLMYCTAPHMIQRGKSN